MRFRPPLALFRLGKGAFLTFRLQGAFFVGFRLRGLSPTRRPCPVSAGLAVLPSSFCSFGARGKNTAGFFFGLVLMRPFLGKESVGGGFPRGLVLFP